jgi:hypothetical protein
MSRKTKKVIIILGVLILLFGAYFGSIAFRNRQHALAFDPFAPHPRLGNLDHFEIVRIEVPGIILERTGDIWELVYLEGGIPAGLELDQREIQMMVFPLSNMWIDRTVDEAPEDLSIYGLDNPSSHVILTDSSGRTAELFRGDLAPTMIHYYAMQKGDPAVYTVFLYHGDLMRFPLDSILLRALFPALRVMDLTLMRLETPNTQIEVIAKPESVPPHLSSFFSSHVLTSPYLLHRGVHIENLQNMLMPVNNLMIEEFVDHNPASLVPYGLDHATRLFLQIGTRSFDLLIGDEINGMHFAKLANYPEVFIISGMESIINARPFDLIDKFVLLVSIDSVDRLTVSGGEQPYNAEIQGQGQNAVFFLNGRRAEARSFRTFYQSVIGILKDAEYASPGRLSQDTRDHVPGEIVVDLWLNTPDYDRASYRLIPYNRDFYLLEQNGTMEFLISRNQVRRIFDTANAVVYEDG